MDGWMDILEPGSQSVLEKSFSVKTQSLYTVSYPLIQLRDFTTLFSVSAAVLVGRGVQIQLELNLGFTE